MGFNELFENQRRRGLYGAQNGLAGNQRQYNQQRSGDLNRLPGIIDPSLDEDWGRHHDQGNSYRNYYDYVFMGTDIKVHIDGLEDSPEFGTIPMVNIAFKVEQEKTPVYGFWDYTYSAVMRGTRIVSGQFTVFSPTTDYMKRLIAAAAKARAERTASYSYHKDLTEDIKNIDKYWTKHIDPGIDAAGKHIFSVHPPFSFVIVYGVQSQSVSANSAARNAELLERYGADNPLMLDINERLVDSDPESQANRIILDAVELTNLTVQYADDLFIVETYEFFARDYVIPPVKSGGAGGPGGRFTRV